MVACHIHISLILHINAFHHIPVNCAFTKSFLFLLKDSEESLGGEKVTQMRFEPRPLSDPYKLNYFCQCYHRFQTSPKWRTRFPELVRVQPSTCDIVKIFPRASLLPAPVHEEDGMRLLIVHTLCPNGG